MKICLNYRSRFEATLTVIFMAVGRSGRPDALSLPPKQRAGGGLAANQGLYSGFLAVGLVFSVLAGPPVFALSLKVFFLACVVVAGVFGALTVSRRILVVQALPAALALLMVLYSRP